MISEMVFLYLFSIYQCLYNAFGCTSVPTVRQSGVFPFAVQQFVEGGGKSEGVLSDKFVGSDAPSLGVFGISVECDAGYVEEGGLFGYVAGVGHYTFSLVDEEAEVQITLGREDMQVGHIKPQ